MHAHTCEHGCKHVHTPRHTKTPARQNTKVKPLGSPYADFVSLMIYVLLCVYSVQRNTGYDRNVGVTQSTFLISHIRHRSGFMMIQWGGHSEETFWSFGL